MTAATTGTARCSSRDVHKSFGVTPIIRGVSLDIAQGERHAIIGPNGAGKSTLFNLVSGRFAPTQRLDPAQRRSRSRATRRPRSTAAGSRAASRSPTSSRASRVYENIRCSVFWSLGYKYNFWRSADKLRRRQRARRTRCWSRSA